MPQYPGVQFDAVLTHTSKAIKATSHSMQVELQADNSAGKFFGGSYCNVHFEIPANAARRACQGWPRLRGHPKGLGPDWPEHDGTLADQLAR
jgi:hypothetical protein